VLKILKFVDADMVPGSGTFYDPGCGMEKNGSAINIPDPQNWVPDHIRTGSRANLKTTA
jgi:hypothetical protein